MFVDLSCRLFSEQRGSFVVRHCKEIKGGGGRERVKGGGEGRKR